MSRVCLTFLFLSLFIFSGWLHDSARAEVRWQSDLQGAMSTARGNNRLVFVEVSAEWCPACRRLDKLTHDKRVGQFLDPHFVSVKLNADDPQGQSLLRKYGVKGIPALFVFSPQGDLKGKMSGAPQDFEGFQHFITKLAGGEAAIAAAGSANSGGWQGNTTSGAAPNGYLPQGQSYQQPYQQQMPYGQPPPGYFPPQFPQGQPQANYAQPQFPQGSPPANYFPPLYQQPQYAAPQAAGYAVPMQQAQPNYQPTQQPGFVQPAYAPAQQPAGYAPGFPPAQNPYGQGVYQPGAQPAFPPGYQQQVPVNQQQMQGQGQFQYQQGTPPVQPYQ